MTDNAESSGAPQRGADGLYHDLDFLIGTWVEDPEFDKAMEEFEQIEPEYWELGAGDAHADA